MYTVKVAIKPTSIHPEVKVRSKTLNGIFVPKGNKCKTSDIESQLRSWIDEQLKRNNPNVNFEYKFTINKIKDDFILKEE